jgi:hypothetical protein
MKNDYRQILASWQFWGIPNIEGSVCAGTRVRMFCVLRNATALPSNACWISLSPDMDVHGKIIGRTGDILAVLLKMAGTGGIISELWQVSVELGDVPLLTVFGVSCHSRDTPKGLQILDEPCPT